VPCPRRVLFLRGIAILIRVHKARRKSVRLLTYSWRPLAGAAFLAEAPYLESAWLGGRPLRGCRGTPRANVVADARGGRGRGPPRYKRSSVPGGCGLRRRVRRESPCRWEAARGDFRRPSSASWRHLLPEADPSLERASFQHRRLGLGKLLRLRLADS